VQATHRVARTESRPRKSSARLRNARIDKIIAGIGIGEWKKATAAALRILKATDEAGRNQTFEELLAYQDLPDNDAMFWPALSTIEMCSDLAPDLLNRSALFQMANHMNFSVRSSAASICMNWAQFAPDRVHVDILLKLSVYDEDWYVQAPANAALRSMASAVPGVLSIFYSRLSSSDIQERAHAAACIADIAEKEPGLLDRDDLEEALAWLTSQSDRDALERVRESLVSLSRKRKREQSRYRYGL
jgi:hypothetical protein